MSWYQFHSIYHINMQTYYHIQITNTCVIIIILYGGFLERWYPTTMGFPTKNDHVGVFWGYHHLRKHPYPFIFIKHLYGFEKFIQKTLWKNPRNVLGRLFQQYSLCTSFLVPHGGAEPKTPNHRPWKMLVGNGWKNKPFLNKKWSLFLFVGAHFFMFWGC